MLHEPAAKSEHDPASPYKTRLGVWMFLLYVVTYAGFVALNLIKPKLMERRIILGLNLAVTYGFFLIVLALLMALAYNRLCTAKEKALSGTSDPSAPAVAAAQRPEGAK